MKLYSYVVSRDYGFAPNPFFGVCTLATCKPVIRRVAKVGDVILGTGSAEENRQGQVVFAMRVTRALSFDEYWEDERYRQKRPYLRGSVKQRVGDNIYHHDGGTKKWLQEDSHHSYLGGKTNRANLLNDTQTPRLLLSDRFVYWGGNGPMIPTRLRMDAGLDVCAQRGHRVNFSPQFKERLLEWLRSLDTCGYAGDPYRFDHR